MSNSDSHACGRAAAARPITSVIAHAIAEQIDALRRFGWTAYYGDATRLDLPRIAGADKARLLVLAIDDVDQSVEIATLAREHFPRLTIVARAQRAALLPAAQTGHDADRTRDARFGADERTQRAAGAGLGWEPHQARNLALRFRRHNIEQLEAALPHWKDQAKLIAAAKQDRQQLEELFAQERREAAERRARAGWSEPAQRGEG